MFRKIPNWLNFAGFAVGLTASTLLRGSSGFWFSLNGAVVGFGILLLPFILNLVGAGDVKFLAASGAFCGHRLVTIGFLGGTAFAAVGCIARFNSGRVFAAANGLASLERANARDSVPYAVPLSVALVTALAAEILGGGF